MGISLQQYRLQIGLFIGSTRSRRKGKLDNSKKSESCLTARLTLLLLVMCFIQSFSNSHFVSSNKTRSENPTNINQYYPSFFLQSEPSSYIKSLQANLYEILNPGGQVGRMSNFWARYINGNRKRGIKLCHWNIGGGYLCNKMDTIRNLVDEYSPHIVGISEASFMPNHSLDDVKIENYKTFFSKTLSNSQLNTSRLAVYVHQDVAATVREDLMDEEFSSVWLEVGLPRQKKFLVSHIYRDWQFIRQQNQNSLTIPEQLRRWDIFIKQWEKAISLGSEIHVQGDFNLNFLDFQDLDNLNSSTQSSKLSSLILALKTRIIPQGFCQVVQGITRMWPGTESTLLDHHWTNREDKVAAVHEYFQGASDHKMICITRTTKRIISKPKLIRKRIFKDFEPQSFLEAVSKTSWLDVYLCEDLEMAVNMVSEKLNTILDEMAPVKVIQVRTNYAPWMSRETKQKIKERDKAQEKASVTKNIEDWEEYKRLRNTVNNTLKIEKKNWQGQKLREFGGDSSTVWKNVKNWLGWTTGGPPTKLIKDGYMYTKPMDMARIMNDYFVTKVRNLRNNLVPSPGDPCALIRRLMSNRTCSLKLKCVHPDVVLKIISGMKSSSSCGVDSIDSRILKLAKHQLVPVITHIVNLSIKNQKFPDSWKQSKVIPLHKKEEVTNPKNYRPVSLLPILSKVLERVIFEQMINYLENNKLLHHSHHGFRASHSTLTALVEMYDQWTEALEKDEATAVVMLDLSAAFDVVDHSILIQKLEILGFEECTVSWVSSYLSGRSQQVYIEGSLSDPLPLEAGVPQGSILGPLLYILFTNDLPEVIHDHVTGSEHEPEVGQGEEQAGLQAEEGDLQHHQQYHHKCQECGGLCIFADDSTYTVSNRDMDELEQVIKVKYQSIAEYMSRNRLVLNSDKTHLIVITQGRNQPRITLDTGSEKIEPRSEERLLGITVSNDLKWSRHIRDGKKSLISILTSRINALNKVASYSSFKNRKMIANGVVMSHITYLIQLYGGCSEYLLSALQVLQNRAARVVTKLDWYTPTETLLLQCGWLSIRQMIQYHSILLLFKTKMSRKPVYMYSQISHTFQKDTRLSTMGGIKDIRRFKSTRANQSFLPRTIKYWNENLPSEIRRETKIDIFKKKLRSWIKTDVKI